MLTFDPKEPGYTTTSRVHAYAYEQGWPDMHAPVPQSGLTFGQVGARIFMEYVESSIFDPTKAVELLSGASSYDDLYERVRAHWAERDKRPAEVSLITRAHNLRATANQLWGQYQELRAQLTEAEDGGKDQLSFDLAQLGERYQAAHKDALRAENDARIA